MYTVKGYVGSEEKLKQYFAGLQSLVGFPKVF